MALIRRFEEEAGRQYQRAKAGGFLHLAIGEEATIVGTASAMDRERLPDRHLPHPRARDRPRHRPEVRDGRALRPRRRHARGGRGGSMHIFDGERRFMGGYGIVGGNLPLAAGLALASDYKGTDAVTVCMFGDGASNTGQLRRDDEPGRALAAAGRLPGREQPLRDGHRRSSATPPSPTSRGRPRASACPGVAGGRHGRARGARDRRRAHPARPRGAPADPGRGLHLPLPRPLGRRPRGLPDQGGGRGVAQEGPGRGLSRPCSRPRA